MENVPAIFSAVEGQKRKELFDLSAKICNKVTAG
jgi:hypothetical protein